MATILLVDDSTWFRNQLKRAFRSAGHTTLEAKQGLDALEVLRGSTPDCILTDLNMPEMGGLELLAALKKQDCTVPRMVITADLQETVRKECLDLGALEVFCKPMEIEDLVRIVVESLKPH